MLLRGLNNVRQKNTCIRSHNRLWCFRSLITFGLHHQSSGTLTKGDTTVVFHTETLIGGKVDFYHLSSDDNNQKKENNNMEISNAEGKADGIDNESPSISNSIKSIGVLLLAGLLMVTFVE